MYKIYCDGCGFHIAKNENHLSLNAYTNVQEVRQVYPPNEDLNKSLFKSMSLKKQLCVNCTGQLYKILKDNMPLLLETEEDEEL